MNGKSIPAIREQRLISLSLLVAALILARLLGGWLAEGSTREVTYIALGIAIALICLSILKDWHKGLYLFVVWMLFEDFPRKYMGNNMILYFGHDVLAILTCLSLYFSVRRGREKTFRPPFLPLFLLFFFLAFIQAFNPNSPSLLYGLLGLKLYFLYVPLMFVGYAFVRTDGDLRRFVIYILVLGALIACVGIAQAIFGVNFLNPSYLAPEIRELSTLQKTTPITHEIVRIPSSVFVSSGRFGYYLVLVTILGMGTAGYLLLSGKRGRWTVFVGLGIVAVALALSGSRGPVMFSGASALVLSAGMLWGAPWRWGQGHRLVKAILTTFLIASSALAVAVTYLPKEIASHWHFYSETLSPGSPSSDLGFRSWSYPMYNLELAMNEPNWLWGNGTGTASLGTQYVSKFLHEEAPRVGVENGYGTLIAEMGVLAPILWIAWSGALLWSLWKVARCLRGTRFFPISLAVLWLAFLFHYPATFLSMALYQNYVTNALMWLLIGAAYRLPELAASPGLVGVSSGWALRRTASAP